VPASLRDGLGFCRVSKDASVFERRDKPQLPCEGTDRYRVFMVGNFADPWIEMDGERFSPKRSTHCSA
jgi:hypothetical protein